MDDKDFMPECELDGFVTRRDFTAAGLGAGAAGALGFSSAEAAARQVADKDVTIKTRDGVCDAALVAPTTGAWPVVLMWPDIVGLRPVKREMAARLAAEGYAVLVPNPFYRSAKAPVFGPDFNFANEKDRAKAFEYRSKFDAEKTASDTMAYIGFLDGQASVKKNAKWGVIGYCMGGPMTMWSAAAAPNRFGGACSFHGGGLVTDKPDIPHLLIPKIQAKYHYAVATNDDMQDPKAKDVLKASHEAVKRPADVEVYAGAQHGWTVPGSAVYNKEQAERAWAKMLALFKTNLV
jgi:carboxymethylenebutenolidase